MQLLEILSAFLRLMPIDAVHGHLVRHRPEFAGIPADLMPVVQDRLAKGVVYEFARRGHRRERFGSSRGEGSEQAIARWGRWGGESRVQTPRGRIWERHPLSALRCEFSERTAAFLVWCVAESSTDPQSDIPESAIAGSTAPMTAADAFLRYLAYRAVRLTPAGRAWRRKPSFDRHLFCRFVYPQDFPWPDDLARPDSPSKQPGRGDFLEEVDPRHWFEPFWFESTFFPVWEALQTDMYESWSALEELKASTADANEVLRIGQSQWKAWKDWTDVLVIHERRDLSRYLLALGHREMIQRDRQRWEDWCGHLAVADRTVAERNRVYEAACFLPRAIRQLEGWTSEAFAVGYLDEHYAATQLWKADWERFEGSRLAPLARSLLASVERVRPAR